MNLFVMLSITSYRHSR